MDSTNALTLSGVLELFTKDRDEKEVANDEWLERNNVKVRPLFDASNNLPKIEDIVRYTQPLGAEHINTYLRL